MVAFPTITAHLGMVQPFTDPGDLKKINKKKTSGAELVRELNSWHSSFEALRATLSGRLPLLPSSRDQWLVLLKSEIIYVSYVELAAHRK